MSDSKPEATPTFEQKLAELESLVEQLESGELELADSLERFKAGIELSRQCREQLEQARRTVDQVMADVADEVDGETIGNGNRNESGETSD